MVMAKVRAAIDGDAPTALFFKAPTISGLARQIKALSAASAQAKPIPSAPYSAEQLAQGIPCWPLQKHLLSQVGGLPGAWEAVCALNTVGAHQEDDVCYFVGG